MEDFAGDVDTTTRHEETNPEGETGEVLQVPATIGRLVMGEMLGEGGMGVVLAAYDRALQRRVAVKLLHSRGSGKRSELERRRLLREARAMARLSHPNVVQVYDAGVVGDQIYLSMELVEGQTLRQWLRAQPRSWSEVLAVFVQAGRGLAAAHAAGLVHRDFKPSNVLLARDGRVLVTDFGLARSTGGMSSSRVSTAPFPHVVPVVADEITALTASDHAVGTPAYMPPEQHMRGPDTNGRADQFAFCAALYEALYGVKPFAGCTLYALFMAKRQGQFQPPRRDLPRPPARVRRAITRGMSGEPAKRWPSMGVLLEQLQRPTASRGRGAGLGLVASLALAASVGTLGLESSLRPAPCDEQTIHDPSCAGADPQPSGADADPAPEELQLELIEASALVEAASYRRAAGLARSIAERAATRGLPRWQARALAVQGEAEMGLARFAEARRHLTEAIHTAEAEGDDRTVIVVADRLGRLLGEHLRRPEEGMQWVRHALSRLDRIEPDPRLRAAVMDTQGMVLLVDGRFEEAEQVLRRAIVLCEQVGDPPPLAEIGIRTTLGNVMLDLGRDDLAEGLLQQALYQAKTRLGGRHPDVGRIAFDLSLVAQRYGRWDEVERLRGQALANLESALGPHHPDVAMALRGLGDVMLDTGRRSEGEPYYRRALEILERRIGPHDPYHPSIIQLTERLAQSVAHDGDVDEAILMLRRAIAMAEQIDDRATEYRVRRVLLWTLDAPEHLDQWYAEADALGRDLRLRPDPLPSGSREDRALFAYSLWRRGRRAEAEAMYRELTEELAAGPPTRELAGYTFDRAQLLYEQGDRAEGLAQARRALTRLADADVADPGLHRAIERWLARHG